MKTAYYFTGAACAYINASKIMSATQSLPIDQCIVNPGGLTSKRFSSADLIQGDDFILQAINQDSMYSVVSKVGVIVQQAKVTPLEIGCVVFGTGYAKYSCNKG